MPSICCIMQEMPTGQYHRRCGETEFRKERKSSSEEAREWLEWLNFSRGLQLQHELMGVRNVWGVMDCLWTVTIGSVRRRISIRGVIGMVTSVRGIQPMW